MTKEIFSGDIFVVPEKCQGPDGQVCSSLASNNCVIGHYVELIENKRETDGSSSMERLVENHVEQNKILAENCPGFNPDEPEKCQSLGIAKSREPFDGPVDYHAELDEIRKKEFKHIRAIRDGVAIQDRDDETQ